MTRSRLVEGHRVIAIVGRAVRGARTAAWTVAHLVAALDHATGTVLRQLATPAERSEIPPAERC